MQPEQVDHLARSILFSPEVFQRRVEKQILSVALKDLQLDLAMYHLLVMLALAEESNQTVNTLGERLAISRSQMTFATDRLVNLGLISRASDEEDRRKVRVDLTLRGRWIVEELTKTIRKQVAFLLKDLSDEEADRLEDGLRLLEQAAHTI